MTTNFKTQNTWNQRMTRVSPFKQFDQIIRELKTNTKDGTEWSSGENSLKSSNSRMTEDDSDGWFNWKQTSTED